MGSWGLASAPASAGAELVIRVTTTGSRPAGHLHHAGEFDQCVVCQSYEPAFTPAPCSEPFELSTR